MRASVLPVAVGATLVALAAVGVSALLGGGSSRSMHWALQDLGTLGGKESIPSDINSRGQVVGASYTGRSALSYDAFVWEKGRMIDLGTFGGAYSSAVAINDHGAIVGLRILGPAVAPSGVGWFNRSVPVVWRNGRITVLPEALVPVTITNRGHVIGSTRSGHALRWSGTTSDLGGLGGPSARLTAANERGQMVGSSQTAGRASHAVLWQDGKMTDLGTLGGLNSGTSAMGIRNVHINGRGQVVGYAATALQTLHPFLWDPTDGMRDLTSLIPSGSGWELLSAFGLAINDAGEILGDGNLRLLRLAYLLSPPTGRVLSQETAGQARESVVRLRQDVQGGTGASPDGTLLYLIDALSAAEMRLAKGETTTAANLLQAFIQQVDAFLQGRAGEPPFTRTEGQQWIDDARAIETAIK